MINKLLKPGWRVYRFDQMAKNLVERIDPGDTLLDRYVGLEHLDPVSLMIQRWGTPSDVIGEKLHFWPGDIIFGKRRAYQRKLAVADFEGICSAHAMVVRANPQVVRPDFLPFFMQSDLFMSRALEISVGSLSPTINWRTLAEQEFPLPPLDEQSEIIPLLREIENSLDGLNNLKKHHRILHRAFIIETFKNILTNLHTIPVSEAGSVLMGRQLSPEYRKDISPKPYLRVANVFDGYLDLTDVKSMDFNKSEMEKYELRYGDVLLNEGQSRELVGRSAIYRNEIKDCCFQNTLIRFRPTKTSPEYAHYYFQFCLYTGRFAAIAKQTTSIAHLGANRFGEMLFPIPEKQQEQKLIDQISALLNAGDEISEKVKLLLDIKGEIFNKQMDGGASGNKTRQ